MIECPRCGRSRARGLLCEPCARALPLPRGLLPAHVSANRAGAGTGWLIDGFGVPHPLAAGRLVVGRRPDADLAIHNTTVSREHAELRRDGEGWEVRDLGSRNGTFVDEQRVSGRSRLDGRAMVRFGGVGFYLIDAARGLPGFDATSIETSHAADAVRYQLAGADLELCLITSRNAAEDTESGGGVILHRRRAEHAWQELGLPRLEHQLLQLLCEQAQTDRASPSPTRGTVATRTLAKKLPFQSRFANEENVRQVVRRARASLGEIGAEELIGSVPGRGYYLSWPLTAS